MIWGYAGVWPREFTHGGSQSLLTRLEFLVEWGLGCTGASASGLDRMEPAERDAVLEFIERHGLLTLGVGGGYFADADEGQRRTEAALESVRRYKDLVRAPIVMTTAGSMHRFMREPSLAEQLDRLAERLPPLVAGCAEMRLRLGIENHGDYYISDLVELCRRVPGLGIFLDTGNTFLIGEPPLPAIRAAAPYTIGTHFKDHRVRPCLDARPLHFEVGPSVLGEGDVGLAEAYQILLDHAPEPRSLVMEIEMVPPADPGPIESLKRSLAFIRSLPEP